MLLAIDPGTTDSAYVIYNGERPIEWGKVDNEVLIDRLWGGFPQCERCAIEMIQNYGTGMAVGADVFRTCVWIGRFAEAWDRSNTSQTDAVFLKRKEVVAQICGSVTGKDANVRQAMKDRFGDSKAIGTKKNPGPLYGMANDVWQALAVAIAYSEANELAWKL